jgi:hypothetical protein
VRFRARNSVAIAHLSIAIAKDRGTVAGNDGKMAIQEQQPCRTKASKKKNATATGNSCNNRKPPKPSSKGAGRKQNTTSNHQPTKAAQAEFKPGEGGSKLLGAFNYRVACDSELIARAVVSRAIGGDMNGARLVAELSGAKAQSSQLTKKTYRRPFPYSAEELAAQSRWPGTPDPQVDIGFGGREPEN